jgi:hypothetical protein
MSGWLSHNLSRWDLRIPDINGTGDYNRFSIPSPSGRIDIYVCSHLNGSKKHYIPTVAADNVCISSEIKRIYVSRSIPYQISKNYWAVINFKRLGACHIKSSIFF